LITARTLYASGRRGVPDDAGFVIDALNDDGSIRSRSARLWPQTEWLKASLLLAETAQDEERTRLMADALSALQALSAYLTPEGLWHDKQTSPGHFADEPAPATSFYHIVTAFQQLAASWPHLADDDRAPLTLA
jgi:mannose/cellobiose epimerase-like protein (N-acyl-D-glucosamine 2-epimerase family)